MAMEWTNNHDIALAREVFLLEPYRLNTGAGLPNLGIISEYLQGMKAFEVAYRELPYPHKQSHGYIQEHQVFVNTLLNAVGLVYSHETLLYTPNLPFLRGQIFHTLHMVTLKFFEKLQS